MSDFLKKFKSVFIVEEGGQPAAESGDQHPAEMTRPMKTTSGGQKQEEGAPNHSKQATGGVLNDKFLEILATALEKNNQEGFDYFEFRQALKNLSKMAMDEPTKYQSAYAMAQTMGATASKLLDSAKHYLNVLQGEQSKFDEAHAQQKAKLVGFKEEEAKGLESAIQQKTEQIKQLTAEIEQHKKRSEQIKSEIAESTYKIESTKSDFEATFINVVGQIQEDIQKIQQHLGKG